MLAAFAAPLLLAGCGDFWQAPSTSTSTSSSGTTSTTTTLAVSPSSVTEGSSVTLTATVSPSAATGTVTFYDGSSSVGTGTLSSGTASTSVSFSTTGSQVMSATYGGDTTYSSSTSSSVTITVTASSSSAKAQDQCAPVKSASASSSVTASAKSVSAESSCPAPALETSEADAVKGGTYSATGAEAAVVEGDGALTLSGTALSASAGNDRGVLLYQSSAAPGDSSFTMTGGSLTYTCSAVPTPACAQGSTASGQNNPATLFSVANATAAISLSDVQVANNTSTAANPHGTLLTAAALDSAWGTAGSNGGKVTFAARGTTLAGDVIVDNVSTAALSILADNSGTGSTLTGAVNAANTARAVTLALDPASLWTVTATSYLTNLSGLDVTGTTINNIDGGGHCVYYTGTINGSAASTTYLLGGSGGGYLAPTGTTGLNCD